jgi:hypothetical protein
LQIRAGLDRHFDPEDKSVDVEIVFDPPTMLPYSDVYGFLQHVASLVTSTKKPKYPDIPGQTDTEYAYAMSDIREKIIALLWDMQRDESWLPELTITLSGNPDRYYHMAQMHLERQVKAAAG